VLVFHGPGMVRLFGPSAGPPPESKVQEVTVDVTDRRHPANKGLPLTS
jgi:hypothetical protein